MRAAWVDRYGPPGAVRVVEVAEPRPGAGEVLVQVEATAVTSGDARIRGGRFPRGFALPARVAFGLRGPRRHVLGMVVAGRVAARGAGVEGVPVGTRVAGMTGLRMGAHAELVAMPEGRLVPLPDGVSAAAAAGALFGGTTALWFLRDRARLAAGERVLVIGASGAVGTSAVQLARHLGADVTGVASAANVALVEQLGASRAIDYGRADVRALPDRYDVVVDVVGALTLGEGRRLLAPGGRLCLVVGSLGETVRARGPVIAGSSPERPEDMAHLLGLVAEGTLRVVEDGRYPLDAIADAHRRVDTGRKVGNVLVLP